MRNTEIRVRIGRLVKMMLRETSSGRAGRSLVVIFARGNNDLFVGDFVNQSVLVRDSTRPIAFQFALERLRLADSFEWRSRSFRYQSFQTIERVLVMRRPLVVLLERLLVKGNDSH